MTMKSGKPSVNVLKRSVLRPIEKRRKEVLSGAGVGEDCAIFSFPEGETVTCVQQGAVDCGAEVAAQPVFSVAQLVQKCANKLATYGAETVGILLGISLPEEAEESLLKEMITDAEAKAKEIEAEIVEVQTTVTNAVSVPVATVTGIGKKPVSAGEKKQTDGKTAVAKAAPGQDVVVSKWIALEGTAVLARKNREKLLARYPAYLVEEAAGFDKYLSVIPEAATAGKSGVCAMQAAAEGGIFGCLWEMAERAGVGLTIDMRKLPLRQETVEVCELCGVNPYELMSGGCLVMTTDDGVGLVAALHAAEIPAVIVGKVTDSNDRILLNGEEVRYMDKPQQDELYKPLRFSPSGSAVSDK